MFGWLKNKHTAQTQPKIEDFFCAAVSAFAQKTDANAYHAALLTGIAVDPITRTEFIRYLGWVAGNVENPEVIIRLTQLVAVLLFKDWTLANESSCRNSLKAKDHEYWLAYCNRDATVFQRRHEDLTVPKIEDVLSADAQLHSIFNFPQMVTAISGSEPKLYQKLVRIGVIVSEPTATRPTGSAESQRIITPNTEGRVAFVKLASDSIKNVIFFGIAVGVIIGIGSHVRSLGLLLFGIHALTALLHIARTLYAAILGILSFTVKLVTLQYKADDFWWDLTNVAQLIEGAIYVLYFVILYRFFFHASAV